VVYDEMETIGYKVDTSLNHKHRSSRLVLWQYLTKNWY